MILNNIVKIYGAKVNKRSKEIPEGIMTGKDARKNNVGGEVLAYVW